MCVRNCIYCVNLAIGPFSEQRMYLIMQVSGCGYYIEW